jgi:uncharacterized DUF497 family protein
MSIQLWWDKFKRQNILQDSSLNFAATIHILNRVSATDRDNRFDDGEERLSLMVFEPSALCRCLDTAGNYPPLHVHEENK